MKPDTKSLLSGLRWLATLTILLTVVGCGSGATAGNGQGATVPAKAPGVVTVEIAYLNHPPVRPVLSDVDKVMASYGDKVSVSRYDFDTPEGAAFAKSRNLDEHTPIAIFLDGKMEFKLGDRQVKFYSFPQGQGTGVVPAGSWTTSDLDAVLAQMTGKTP